jgi:hypothetical protein
MSIGNAQEEGMAGKGSREGLADFKQNWAMDDGMGCCGGSTSDILKFRLKQARLAGTTNTRQGHRDRDGGPRPKYRVHPSHDGMDEAVVLTHRVK